MDMLGINCTPPEVREAVQHLNDELLPQKSKSVYLKTYETFKHWCVSKGTAGISENVLLAYFIEYANDKKASTLWAHYSMLKATIKLKENIDISKFFKLIAYLKRQNKNYVPRKSSVFSKEDITKFVTQAADDLYIAIKAVLVIGVAGACRGDELSNLLMTDVDNKDDIIVINIRQTKNGSSRKFVVTDALWIEIIKKYIKCRSHVNLPRLFVGIRNGKATRQYIGHNTISQMPNKIATFLNLADPGSFTGHSFRRTSATILAASGGNTLQLKQHGGWKSATVAEGYIEDSLILKRSIADMLRGPCTTTSTSAALSVESQRLPSSAAFPSTSSSAGRVPCNNINDNTNLHNTVINLPTTALTNTSGATITMTCHNCTINYNFGKQ